MKKMKLFATLAVTAAMGLSLAACGGGSSAAPAASDSGSTGGGAAAGGEKIINAMVERMDMPHVVDQLRKLEAYGMENEQKYPWMPSAWNRR